MSAGELKFGAVVGSDGVWCELLNRTQGAGLRPALFLDRDGVVVEEVHYLHRVEDTRLVPGASDVIGHANRAGVPVVVVTNQSGIGRGTYGWPEFAAVQETMLEALNYAGAFVNAVYACPFHEDGIAPWRVAEHPDRKPSPGMLNRAASRLALDLSASWIIGDRAGDVGAGLNAGLTGAMHVASGHGNVEGERAQALDLSSESFRVLTGNSIADARGQIPLLA